MMKLIKGFAAFLLKSLLNQEKTDGDYSVDRDE